MNHGSQAQVSLGYLVTQFEPMPIVTNGDDKLGMFVEAREDRLRRTHDGEIENEVKGVVVIKEANLFPISAFFCRLRDDHAVPPCPDNEKAIHFKLPRNFSIVS